MDIRVIIFRLPGFKCSTSVEYWDGIESLQHIHVEVENERFGANLVYYNPDLKTAIFVEGFVESKRKRVRVQ